MNELLRSEGLSAKSRDALESFHPMYTGGNYLPRTEQAEVEIGRIRIASTTSDVTCVYARAHESLIHYRVVDEYGGKTRQRASETRTNQPMTLGVFAEFFLRAWSLVDVLEMNFEGDCASALDFFSAENFYPDFDLLCRQRVRDHFPEPEPD
ncbi:hypothetical protein JJB11_21840 [Ramlibacter ginsenosidimutans]|uniref:Uncharacterized protein n=1 Tax=Ramlibacter ginsenosidimutans TaxID=502333 RepID=A0A934WNC8_9BURK|nr:hypothetical protein [Ramlibacter ginsenosidimutans]MBK6008749.1 hypothetical protein [Ramlibacter ginsenosidimutans]